MSFSFSLPRIIVVKPTFPGFVSLFFQPSADSAPPAASVETLALWLGDIFLVGNTFENNHPVTKEPLAADPAAGLSNNWRNTNLSYAYRYRRREFKGQEEVQIFGPLPQP